MDKFVVDAGPFIHLHQVGRLGLLGKLSALLIPASVLSELRQESLQNQIEKWPHAEIISVSREAASSLPLKKLSLDRGETDCLCLALRNPGHVFLTDDLAARNAAERLSIEVHGTVGILAYAARHGWLTAREAEESLNLLYHRSSLFITYAIIESAILALRQAR